MCGSGSSRHSTSGGLSPSGKVASISSRDQGFVLALSYSRVKILGKQGMLGSSDVAATPAMVSQLRCTGARVGAGWKVGVRRACVGKIGKEGEGAGGNVVAPCCLVPFVPALRACIDSCLSGGA